MNIIHKLTLINIFIKLINCDNFDITIDPGPFDG